MLHTTGLTDWTPEEAGYDASRITLLQAHFQKLMDQKKIQAASYCVSRHGKIFINEAMGPLTHKAGETKPLLTTSVHRIASITKTVTAVAIAKLVEDGLTRFDMPVGTYLPPFDKAPFNKIDLYSLLSHTSGMHPDCAELNNPYHTSYWDLVQQCFEKHDSKDGEPDWVEAALSAGVSKKVGEEWQYCSFGYVILGEVIHKITGMHAHEYVEKHILRPLGMTDTFFAITQEGARRSIIRNDRQEEYLKLISSGQQPEQGYTENLWKNLVPGTGGGLYSTTSDLMRFAHMLLGMGRLGDKRILGRKTVEKITTRSLFGVPNYCWGANDKDRSYAYGLDTRNGPGFLYSPTTYFHEGAGACCMVIDPTEQLAAVWFVPFADDGWHSDALFNVSNLIWSGLI